jgi:hypothetical protein
MWGETGRLQFLNCMVRGFICASPRTLLNCRSWYSCRAAVVYIWCYLMPQNVMWSGDQGQGYQTHRQVPWADCAKLYSVTRYFLLFSLPLFLITGPDIPISFEWSMCLRRITGKYPHPCPRWDHVSRRSRGPIACAAATFLSDRYFRCVANRVVWLFGSCGICEVDRWIDWVITPWIWTLVYWTPCLCWIASDVRKRMSRVYEF